LARPFQPGEEIGIGRRKPVPEFLDLVGLDIAQIGQRLPGEARRDADAQAAGDQLDQRETAGDVKPVEQVGYDSRAVCAAGRLQGRQCRRGAGRHR
jgi:hypothetical protein